ncbi:MULTISPECIES: hypothetical protein [Actinoalloteichus]|uniref:hypothetical protein n=1 Tax=Actinoalloteichus TaxID=65496 RepID=UPI0012FBBAA9|nr:MULTISPECIES: hypothetical protein [Actinoalloteichus]
MIRTAPGNSRGDPDLALAAAGVGTPESAQPRVADGLGVDDLPGVPVIGFSRVIVELRKQRGLVVAVVH